MYDEGHTKEGDKSDDGTDGNKQGERQGTRERASRDEHTSDRVAAGVGGCAPAAPREGEGFDPLPGRAGRRTPADALAGRGQEVRVRRTQGQGKPSRFVRRPPSVDRLSPLLRARGVRL